MVDGQDRRPLLVAGKDRVGIEVGIEVGIAAFAKDQELTGP